MILYRLHVFILFYIYIPFVTLLFSSLLLLRVKEYHMGSRLKPRFEFEWLEISAKPRRIRYYIILFRIAREIIISMRALRALMKFPIVYMQRN